MKFVLFLLLIPQVLSLPCEDVRSFQLKSARIGTYVAQCDEGAWLRKQCHGSTGFCWCVDEEGTKLGSAVPPASLVVLEC